MHEGFHILQMGDKTRFFLSEATVKLHRQASATIAGS